MGSRRRRRNHELNKRDSLTPDGRIDPEWEIRHRAFHYALLSACGSKRLLQVRDLLFDHADRYRRLSHHYPKEVRDHVYEHNDIAKAVIARDPEAATYLIKRHFTRTVEILLAAPDLEIENDAPAGVPDFENLIDHRKCTH